MSVKPILFSTQMVQAILAGRKIMTRRVIKPQPDCPYVGFDNWRDSPKNAERLGKIRKMPCAPGDILWVREAWCPCATINGWLDDVSLYGYKADYDRVVPWKWKPSIHMPREAARIFLCVKDVRVERVQDILCGDMKREGVIPKTVTGGQYQQWQNDYFKPAWDARNAKRGFGWDSNPWVWVYSFERVDKPAGWPGGEGEHGH